MVAHTEPGLTTGSLPGGYTELEGFYKSFLYFHFLFFLLGVREGKRQTSFLSALEVLCCLFILNLFQISWWPLREASMENCQESLMER